jgi:hypothetical protein
MGGEAGGTGDPPVGTRPSVGVKALRQVTDGWESRSNALTPPVTTETVHLSLDVLRTDVNARLGEHRGPL